MKRSVPILAMAMIVTGSTDLGEIRMALKQYDEAALDRRFKPSFLNGRPVKVKGILTFNFTS